MLPISNIKFFIILFFCLILYGCDQRPEYPTGPVIKLTEAGKVTLADGRDSLFVRIDYTDGDGDLGLSSTDQPNLEFRYDITPQGDTNFIDGPYTDCQTQIPSTNKVYKIIRQPNFYNYFVDVWIKNPNSNEFNKYNFENCLSLNGRFSRLDPDDSYKGPIEGNIARGFAGSFNTLFSGQTIIFEISIQDRNLNRSNVVRTQEFRF